MARRRCRRDDHAAVVEWLAARRADQQRTELHHLHGNDPAEICHQACTKALRLLTATLTG